MRALNLLTACVLVAMLVALHGADAQEGNKPIKPAQRWTGKIGDKKLAAKAPKNGVIAEKKAFEDLWKAWRGEEKLPEVDFGKQIVFVHTAGGPNVPSSNYTLDAEGNLKSNTLSTLIGGAGFGYSIDALNKEGIKTYQGKKIE